MLSAKAKAGKIAALEAWELPTPKTKHFLALRQALPQSRSILVIHNGNESLKRSSRNVAYTKALNVRVLNVHDLLKYDLLLIEQSAVARAAELMGVGEKATKGE